MPKHFFLFVAYQIGFVEKVLLCTKYEDAKDAFKKHTGVDFDDYCESGECDELLSPDHRGTFLCTVEPE